MTNLARVQYIAFIILFTYFVILTLYYLILAIIAIIEERKRTHQYELEDYTSIRSSIFTLPVSIIIAAHNEEEWIANSLKAALQVTYPEFEVIIVDDGSTDATPDILREELKLEPVDKSHLVRFHTGKIREIFKSTLYPNVTVITKAGGFKKAGAVNIGLEFAQYKYVCVIDADTIIEPDALLKVMPHLEKDPDTIIGAGSYFGLVNGFKIKDGTIAERSFSYNPIIAYQNLEYLRSFIACRTALSRFNASPTIAGGFGIWRKDILLDLGGYATDFSCEDLEFTFRAHDYIIENEKEGYVILSLPYFVGWTEGPATIASLVLQRSRWQRVIDEAVWQYKHMLFSRRHKAFAFLSLPYFLFYEALGVFFEVAGIALVIAGALTGILNLHTFLAYLSLMILSQAIIALLSIFAFIRGQKVFSIKYISYLVFLSFVEFFWYHWILMYAKIMGTINYMQGVKVHDQYKRSKQSVSA